MIAALARCTRGLLVALLLLSLFAGVSAHGQAMRAGVAAPQSGRWDPPPPLPDDPVNNAGFISQVVPTTMTAGASHTVTVRMFNKGNTVWNNADGYRLGSTNPMDNGRWGGARVLLARDIAPGQTAEFKFQATAPAQAGSYNFQWQMVQDGVEWFGAPSQNVVVDVAAPARNDAQPVSQSVPSAMLPSGQYTVSLTFANTGTTIWDPANGNYVLAAVNPVNNATWVTNRIGLPGPVAPGQQVTIAWSTMAPASPGTYHFQWMMLQEGVELFGTPSANVDVVVSPPAPRNDAQFISQTVPATMKPGQSYPVTVTMRNAGTTTWTATEQYRLASNNPPGNSTWSLSRVELPATTPPGQTAVFSFNVVAPAAPGAYQFEWRMLREWRESFGPASPTVAVQVTAQSDTVIYIHTDALGSPVARSDSAGNVISRTSYEPYGRTAAGVTPTIGFTGHVNDADTGLVYMQQRYYDPVAGRFLSVDPVVTDPSNANSFNRYVYANDSPYRYIDPDGRDARDEQIASDLARSRRNVCNGQCSGDVRASDNRHAEFYQKSGLGPNLRGTEAVAIAEDELVSQGFRVIGREVEATTFGISYGRRYDLLVENPLSGNVFGVEVKSSLFSSLKLNERQVLFDVGTIKNGAFTNGGVRFNGVMYRGVGFGTNIQSVFRSQKLLEKLVEAGAPVNFTKPPLP